VNILHVIDVISQTHGGGSARVAWHLAKEQAVLGHQVALYSTDYQASQKDAPPGVEMRLFPSFCLIQTGYRVAPGMLLAGFRKADIVHLHNYRTVPNLMASLWHKPFVIQADGSALPIPAPRHWYSQWWKQGNDVVWRNVLVKRARRLIACNPYEIAQYLAEGAPKARCVQTDLGIDVAEFTDIPARSRQDKTILFVGRFHYHKGPDLLVRAFARLNMPDVTLVLAGWDNGYLAETRRVVEECGVAGRVEFPGYVQGRQLRQLYADADLYVLPSRYEAYGLCIQEACACGTPVLVSRQCAIADRIPEYCGRAVCLNEHAMARAMQEMLTEPDNRRAERIAWARGFGWDRIARDLVKMYEEVLR